MLGSKEVMVLTDESTKRFFDGASHLLIQQTDTLERQVSHFFTDLQFRCATFRELQGYLDRNLANDFNIFDYIAPDENRLSKIIADLLRPDSPHGQSSIFLEAFLQLIRISDERYYPDKIRNIVQEDSTVYASAFQRRIDITLDFGYVGIGIENKPWAGEQQDQLQDYQVHLSRKYSNNFVLIYLSGNGTEPQSLTPQTMKDLRTQGRLRVLTYRPDLQRWLETCYKECHAEKVRWFLRDFAKYVTQHFPILHQP